MSAEDDSTKLLAAMMRLYSSETARDQDTDRIINNHADRIDAAYDQLRIARRCFLGLQRVVNRNARALGRHLGRAPRPDGLLKTGNALRRWKR